MEVASLKTARGRPRHLTEFFEPVQWCQLRIVAGSDSQQLVDHELVLAPFDLNLPDGSCHDVGSDGLDDAIADAERGTKGLVDTLKPRRDVDPVAHHRIAQPRA